MNNRAKRIAVLTASGLVGAAVVNAVGPIRQIVDPAADRFDLRRYLAVMSVENEAPGRAVQLQQPASTRSSVDQ